jgi:hypothetical protein
LEFNRRAKANARNAVRSTGPKTETGKATSSLNALKHGLLARETLLEGEDASALSELDGRLRKTLDPQGELEGLLVDQIVSSLWRLRRLYWIEAGVLAWYQRRAEKEQAKDWDSPTRIKRIIDEEGHGGAVARLDETEARQAEEVVTLGLAFIQAALEPDALSKLSRYETTIERGLYRALHELQRLQAARTGQLIAPPVAVDVNLSSTG